MPLGMLVAGDMPVSMAQSRAVKTRVEACYR